MLYAGDWGIKRAYLTAETVTETKSGLLNKAEYVMSYRVIYCLCSLFYNIYHNKNVFKIYYIDRF